MSSFIFCNDLLKHLGILKAKNERKGLRTVAGVKLHEAIYRQGTTVRREPVVGEPTLGKNLKSMSCCTNPTYGSYKVLWSIDVHRADVLSWENFPGLRSFLTSPQDGP